VAPEEGRLSPRLFTRGVAGTPTFFINGRRHDGAYDVATLSRAVKTAGAHSLVAT
jgi:hypothetical protein